MRDSRTKEQIRRLRRVRSSVGVDALDSRLLNSQFFGFWHDFQSEATNAWFGEFGIDYFDPSHSPIGNGPSNFIDTYHLPEKGTSQALDGSEWFCDNLKRGVR